MISSWKCSFFFKRLKWLCYLFLKFYFMILISLKGLKNTKNTSIIIWLYTFFFLDKIQYLSMSERNWCILPFDIFYFQFYQILVDPIKRRLVNSISLTISNFGFDWRLVEPNLGFVFQHEVCHCVLDKFIPIDWVNSLLRKNGPMYHV